MNEISAETRFSRGMLAGSRIEDEMVFFNQETGKYYSTGSVGADIWEFLNAPRAFSDICSHLAGLYNVDPRECETQTREFLTEMTRAGLLFVVRTGIE
jgi:hypothetical protein